MISYFFKDIVTQVILLIPNCHRGKDENVLSLLHCDMVFNVHFQEAGTSQDLEVPMEDLR